MLNLKKILRKKAAKRIIALVIASTLGYLGVSGELSKEFAKVSAEIISEEVVE
jgi:hypothetical protein|tara:strand:+ start:185 stop:343 length:159 start_codon:yes stop_codon:yes gene_type:complete